MTEYVGFDVSKEETTFCVKDAAGKILARGKVATDPRALFEALKAHCLYPARIVMETGTLSGWLVRELAKLGIAVDVIDARQAHAVMRLQHNKTDANDAELLAEIARTGFCRSVAKLYGPRGAIGLAACEDGPGNARGLVGDSHGDHSRRFALEQLSYPGPVADVLVPTRRTTNVAPRTSSLGM